MSNTAPPVGLSAPLSVAQRSDARTKSSGALPIFLAVLGPMSTVPAIRRLLVDGHGQGPSLIHWFVAAGMVGSLLGAPLIAARADRRQNHLSLAVWLCSLDAAVLFATSLPIPTAVLFALRPIHGAASMAALALLFARFRGSRRELVSRAGAAAVAALAVGPALGGALTRLGPAAPFLFAAVVSASLAVALAVRSQAASAVVPRKIARETGQIMALARVLWSPLLLVASQRFVIGGLVAALAIHARETHGFSDAQVGMCFSTLLVLFAAGIWWLGRRPEQELPRWIIPGGVGFALAIASLSIVPASLLVPMLAVAGLGAAFVYAPCLALAAGHSRSRATPLALLNAAGGVGMVLGPLGALAISWALGDASQQLRTGAFMAASGLAHAICALLLLPRLQHLTSTNCDTPSTEAAE